MLFDFHTHTYLSDGALSPLSLIWEARTRGYTVIAVTDHVGLGDMERVLSVLVRECQVATREMGVLAIPGVEISYVPPPLIPQAARQARELGARVVLVHGETPVEPVPPGTNRAALECPEVDILAHPGLIPEEVARLVAERGAFLELSAKKGHSLANGYVAQVARRVGAPLLLDSDAHDVPDLLTEGLALKVALGAGLAEEEAHAVLRGNPLLLLRRLGLSLEGVFNK